MLLKNHVKFHLLQMGEFSPGEIDDFLTELYGDRTSITLQEVLKELMISFTAHHLSDAVFNDYLNDPSALRD